MPDNRTFGEFLSGHLQHAADRTLLRVVTGRGGSVAYTGAELHEAARDLGARYASDRSGVVLILLPHCPELFLLHFGLILNGAVPAILAWPTSRIDPEKYQRNLLHQLRSLPARRLVTVPALARNLGAHLPYEVCVCEIQDFAAHEKMFAVQLDPGKLDALPAAQHIAPLPSDAVFLQFTGGTTGSQKAVVVTESMLAAQLNRLRECLRFGSEDAVVSWLPMYHDMGLIGCLWFPLWCDALSVQFAAGDWLLDPEALFRYMQQYRGTFCWLPNFAFSYLAAQRGRMSGSYDLSQVRGWISCSEPVRAASMKSFASIFADWGVAAEALQASYAMAENVFAVTQTPPGCPPTTFPRSALRRGGSPDLAFDLIDDVYVSSGHLLPGAQLRIRNGGGLCSECEPGNIEIRTEALFSGYWGDRGFVTSSISADGWYSTGDYGFTAGADLYVIGRMKDIVIVGGQNVFPEDVETVVNSMEGVYPGRVVAFGVEDQDYGTEVLAVVAELRGGYDRTAAQILERGIQQLVLSAIGIAPRYVLVVPERWIVKSTAGKISRQETRLRFQQERAQGFARVKGAHK